MIFYNSSNISATVIRSAIILHIGGMDILLVAKPEKTMLISFSIYAQNRPICTENR